MQRGYLAKVIDVRETFVFLTASLTVVSYLVAFLTTLETFSVHLPNPGISILHL